MFGQRPVLEKSIHKVTVYHYQESLHDKFDMLWKIIALLLFVNKPENGEIVVLMRETEH